MWPTYRLPDQVPYTREAGSRAPFHFKDLNSHVAMNGAYARDKPIETSLGQDLSDIWQALSRQGPFGLFRAWRERWHYRR